MKWVKLQKVLHKKKTCQRLLIGKNIAASAAHVPSKSLSVDRKRHA